MIKIYNRFDGELIKEFDLDTLSGCDLRDCDLRGSNLRNSNLSGCDLRGSNLRNSNLSGCDLRGCDLRDCDLRGSNLRNSNLSGCDLRGSNLSGCDLRGSLIVIYGLQWEVYITKNHIRIGCQAHDLGKWESFTDEEIDNMDSNALDFWKENKEMIITLCKRLK